MAGNAHHRYPVTDLVDSYVKDGCRCEYCSKAYRSTRAQEGRRHRKNQRVLVDGLLIAPVAPQRHGTTSVYVMYGCQCSPCYQAYAEYQKRYREKKKG